MANITITNVDLGPIQLGDNYIADKTLNGTTTQAFLAGTLLARQVNNATYALGTVTGTGDRAMVATAQASRTPTVGVYTLTAGTLSSQVGPWTLVGPDGKSETFTSTAAGDTLIFPIQGIQITVVGTGGTAYTTGATRTVTVAANTTPMPFVAFSPTGSNGAQVPCAVLAKAVTLASSTAQAVVIMSGKVNATRLIIAADADGDDITSAQLDSLRSYGIIAIPVQQTAALDNQ